MRDFQESIPGLFVSEGLPSPGPVEMLDEPPRDLRKLDPGEMTERELLIAIVLELRAAREERKPAVNSMRHW